MSKIPKKSCTLSGIDLSEVSVVGLDMADVRAKLEKHGFVIVSMKRFFADVVLKEMRGARYRRWFLLATGDYYLLDSEMIEPSTESAWPIDAESEAAMARYCEGKGPAIVP